MEDINIHSTSSTANAERARKKKGATSLEEEVHNLAKQPLHYSMGLLWGPGSARADSLAAKKRYIAENIGRGVGGRKESAFSDTQRICDPTL